MIREKTKLKPRDILENKKRTSVIINTDTIACVRTIVYGKSKYNAVQTFFCEYKKKPGEFQTDSF